jgi:hypothetical protein
MRWFAIAGMLIASSGMAQQAVPPVAACSGAEYRALDFWVGDWTAEWEQNGRKGTGTNRITRDEYGSCVITERFRIDDGSFNGFSISTYTAGAQKWRQTWMDDQGGYIDLVGGPVSGSDHIFMLETKRASETAPYQRMIFQDVKQDSFTWRWQRRGNADEPWQDQWVIRYRRKAAGAPTP